VRRKSRRAGANGAIALVAVLLGAAALGACSSDDTDASGGNDSGSASTSTAEPAGVPTGATDVVASRSVGGGLVMQETELLRLPDLVLYGSGDAYAGTTDGRVFALHLSPDELHDLLAQLDDTGLGQFPAQVEPSGDGPVFADGSTTTLQVWSDGALKSVAAYVLDVPEVEYPDRLRQANQLLIDLGHRTVTEGVEWQPDRIRLVAVGTPPESEPAIEWPASVPVPVAISAGDPTFPQTADVTDATDAAALVHAFGGRHRANVLLPAAALTIAWRALLPHE
jgi:hypothetical protein